MDISKINEKPAERKPIQTLSKPEKKINELWPSIKRQLNRFWKSNFLGMSIN